jgi:hypothetical protein
VLVLLVMSTGFCAANTVDLYVIGSQPHALILNGFSVSDNWTVPQANVQDGLLMTLAVGTGYTFFYSTKCSSTHPSLIDCPTFNGIDLEGSVAGRDERNITIRYSCTLAESDQTSPSINVNVTIKFFSHPINGEKILSLIAKNITCTAATPSTEVPTDDGPDNGINPIFYGVIGLVGVVIVLVAVVGIVYQCVAIKRWFRANSSQEEEETNE